jgi:outer membrane protein assembly factor BamB
MNRTLQAAFLAAMGIASAAFANDWHQWRGPEQDGVSRETNLPDKWSPDDENVAWTNDVGGMSSPIVMNGKLYTFTRVGEVPTGEGLAATLSPGPKTQEALTCVDAKTGKVIWQHMENMYMTDDPFHRIGWSNPVGDPKTGRVYALGAQNVLICCDGQTGKQIWRHQMTEEFGLISTFGGRTPSPAVDDEQLYLSGVDFGWGDLAGGKYRIFAFDKATGRLNWINDTTGVPTDAPYQTPVLTVIHGEKVLVVSAGDGSVDCFQARTGKRVWRVRGAKRGMNCAPLVVGDKVFASWDLDNYDSTTRGRVICVDGATVENGAPKELWRRDGIEAGFPSPTYADGTLYVVDDKAVIYAIDASNGKLKYRSRGLGTIGKASLVWGDGKLYFAEGNGRFSILKPNDSAKKFDVVSKVDLPDKAGREYAIFGSVAISNGHIYLEAANKMYCIGPKEFKEVNAEVPKPPEEEPLPNNAKSQPPAWVQVVPFDVVLHPGGNVKLTARGFDAKGRFLGDVTAKWEVGQVTIPAPPPRPAALNRPNEAAAAQGRGGTARPAAPATPPPPTGPTKAGNLEGKVSDDGTFTAGAAKTLEGGAIIATVGNVTGESRVRIFPPLPWKFDFEKAPIGKPPLTWIGAGGKFAGRDLENNKVLVKLTDIPLFARARTYFGTADESNYTVQGDIRVKETVYNNGGQAVHIIPDAGLINSRYVLELKGANQWLGLHAWPAAIPPVETQPGLATHAAVPFKWQADKWYRLKLSVEQQNGKAVCLGKAWPADQAEPKDWTIKLVDEVPNTHGSPGLWGFSNDHEIYYDNIVVTPNGNAQASAR